MFIYPHFSFHSPVGSVANITGASACIACEPGTAVTLVNTPLAYCQPCAPGMFSVSSSSQQVYITHIKLDIEFENMYILILKFSYWNACSYLKHDLYIVLF